MNFKSSEIIFFFSLTLKNIQGPGYEQVMANNVENLQYL